MSSHPNHPVFEMPGRSLGSLLRSEGKICERLSLPVRLEMSLHHRDRFGLFHAPDSLDASLVLAGLGVRATLTTRAPDGRLSAAPVALDATVLPPGDRVSVAHRLLRPELGWNESAIRVLDQNGLPLAEQRQFGLRAGAPPSASFSWRADVEATVWVSAIAWAPGRGPRFVVSGQVMLIGGVVLQLELPCAAPSTGNAHERRFEMELIHPGRTHHFHDRTLECITAGAPFVSVRLTDDAGLPLGEDHLLGRCLIA